jgi:6-methylsalicylate decarboxylase
MLDIAFEPSGMSDLTRHDPQRRIRELDEQETDIAVVSISTPVGCEALPADEAAPLVDAYNRGIAEVVRGSGGRLRAMAAVVLDDIPGSLAGTAQLLDEGFVGVCVPSEVLVDEASIERVAPLLELVQERGAPIFVHPGPGPWTRPQPCAAGLPSWWTSLGQYPALSQAAFFTWRAVGAARFPRLLNVWAILAGGAPFLEHRYRVFSGQPGSIDPNIFFDTASSGREALELTLSTYGAEQVVYGSDHAVIPVEPTRRAVEGLGPGAAELVLQRNVERLFETGRSLS